MEQTLEHSYKEKKLRFIGVKLSQLWAGLDEWMDGWQVRKVLIVNPPSSLGPQTAMLYLCISQTNNIAKRLYKYIQQQMGNQVPECGLISPKQNNVYTTVQWWLQPSAGGTS